MSNVLVDASSLTAIGNAIRNKNGSTVKYKPSEMADAIANIKNETYVESDGSWGIIINQQEKETVTAKPVVTLKTEGDRYRSKLSLELGVSAYTQYIPGQITQSLDAANKNFVIDITPAIPIAGMVTEDGWAKVYIKNSKFYDNENYSGSPLSNLSGNILVAGAQTNTYNNSLSSKNSLLKYKDNFTIKVGSNFLDGCSNLTSVNLPNLTTITGDYFMNYCTRLTSVDLPNLTTTGTYFMNNCSSLTSVDLPNLTTTTGDYFMNNCTRLTSVDLPNLTTITGDYFMNNCTSLTSVDLPNLTTTGANFLAYCNELSTVTVKKEIPPTTTSTTSLKATLYVPKAYVTAYSKSKFGKLFKSIVGI